MQRFLTVYLINRDEVQVFSEQEHKENVMDQNLTLDDFLEETFGEGYSDFVWQWAENKEQAKQRHFQKLDLWEANPNLETY